METKKTKYDTNPLDPEAERKAAEEWNHGGSGNTQQVHRATRDVDKTANESARPDAYSEAPTRRIDAQSPDAHYQSVFVPPTYAPPTRYQPQPQSIYAAPVEPGKHSVAGLGIPERWATMLVYAPWYIGLVVSLVELFLVPRKEVRTRFHASQALAVHLAILIIQTVFGIIGTVTNSGFGKLLFGLAAAVFLVISMVRVWRGEPHRIAPVEEPAKWFNQHIEPRNQG